MENMTYVVDDAVNVTCAENKTFSLGSDQVGILCKEVGWEVPPPCHDACTGDPPEPGRNMTQLNFTSNFIGDNVTYVCEPGHFIPSTFPDLLNETAVVCGEDHLWRASGTGLECAIICVEDPVTPPPPAILSWDGQNRTYGTEVLLECPDGLRFADERTNISLTCQEDGNWTQPDQDLLICRIRAEEPPENVTGASLEGPDPPHWKDSVLNYTCNDGWLTTSGEKQTTVMFTGTTWVMKDPDFACWKVAEGPPENITDATLEGPEAPYWKTVTLNFTCHEGYLTTGGEKWTNVTFNGTDWVLGDHDFACWKTCDEDPVRPPAPATFTWEGQKRTYMAKVLLECPDGLRFANESTYITLTCEDDGNWTQPDEDLLICRIRADEPPENVTGASLEGPDPPHWKDSVLNYTCNDGWLTTSGEKQTTVMFTGTTWVMKDPDFACWKVADEPPETITDAMLEGPDPPYWKTVSLNYTCNDGYLSTEGEKWTSVTFNGTAWETDNPEFTCWKVASEPPQNITDATLEGPDPPYWKTVTLNYTCIDGYLTADGTKWTNVTFDGTSWILSDPDFACLIACPSPPAPEAYVRRNYTGKGVDGDTALYVCAGMFDSGNDTVEISCSSGNWSLDVLPECGKGEEIGELGEIGEEG
ncbi:sushi, von Willebrand factor type A, EGF and pentraxin domain-containing protein 1 [Penaeus vannamei]|uniref:sushi, von Willebrand factor type A, EGF and pentraxin domain-containing protein 1 n=1 Tax=Penaeus vannamei TaxID=6689 RepID=UPI00387F8927